MVAVGFDQSVGVRGPSNLEQMVKAMRFSITRSPQKMFWLHETEEKALGDGLAIIYATEVTSGDAHEAFDCRYKELICLATDQPPDRVT